MSHLRHVLVAAAGLVAIACDDTSSAASAGVVFAHAETVPSGNDPDDPSIWIHPTDPSKSLILGTDKGLGFFVYALDGSIVQTVPGYAPNNVDLRHGVAVSGSDLALAAAVDRNTDSVALLGIDETGHVSALPVAHGIDDFGDLYGNCLYRSTDGTLYVFVNAKSGEFRQYRMTASESGEWTFTDVRAFAIPSQPEGCVADDEHGVLYLGEEDGGLHRIGAEPTDGTTVTTIDRVGEGRLVADVEGMTIYPTANGGGYLLVSSQGSDEYIVYDRAVPNAYLTRFRIGEGGGHDAATDTDGIDVTPVSLGSAFPDGLFVAQDDHNDGFTRNFKLVRWGDIAGTTELPLVVDTSVSPRR